MSSTVYLVRDEKEYEISVDLGKAMVYKEKFQVPESVRQRILAKISAVYRTAILRYQETVRGVTDITEIREPHKNHLLIELEDIARHIYDSYLPVGARQFLSSAKPAHVKIVTNDSEFPWEIMHDGDDFLFLKYAVGRTLLTSRFEAMEDIEIEERVKILFVANPEGNLEEAQREVAQIAEELEKEGSFEITLLQYPVTVAMLTETLRKKKFDVIHFACHVDYDPAQPDNTRIILLNEFITPKYLQNVIGKKTPFFVFMNACSTARGVGASQFEGEFAGIAGAFLNLGVRAYVGTLWEVHDSDSAKLALSFYKNLLSEKSLGEALRDARKSIFLDDKKRRRLTWVAPVLFGDPTLRIHAKPSFERLQRIANGVSKQTLYEMRTKYDPDLYVDRKEVKKQFENFLPSEKTGFILVGDSGSGKTNLFCNLAEKYGTKNVVLLYHGNFLTSPFVRGAIVRDLEISDLNSINEIVEKRNAFFIVMIDAVNEAGEKAKDLLKGIAELVDECSQFRRLKIVLSCRTVLWNLIADISLERYKENFFKVGSEDIELRKFSESELEQAYGLYKEKFDLKTEFPDLSTRTKDTCKIPLMLRFTAEVYAGKEIPQYVPSETIFDEYFRKKVEPGTREFLKELVRTMRVLKTDRPSLQQLILNPVLESSIKQRDPLSPFLRLKNENVLFENERKGVTELRFTYERFFEFLLAQELLFQKTNPTKDDYIHLIREGQTFSPLLGAAKTALWKTRDKTILTELAAEEEFAVRNIVEDALVTIGDEDYKFIEPLLREFLKSTSLECKRLAVTVAQNMLSPSQEILIAAVLSSDIRLRKFAIQHTYFTWRKNRDVGFKIFKGLLSHVRIQDLKGQSRFALESCFELSIKIFMNHLDDKQSILKLYNLWFELPGGFLLLPSKKKYLDFLRRKIFDSVSFMGVGILKSFLTRDFVLDFENELVPVFSLSVTERENVRRILQFLDKDREGFEEIIPLLLEMAGSKLDVIRRMVLGVLIVQAFSDFERIKNVLEKLSQRTDPEALAFILGFYAFYGRNCNPGQRREIAVPGIRDILEKLYPEIPKHEWIIMDFSRILSKEEPGRPSVDIERIIMRARQEQRYDILQAFTRRMTNLGYYHPDNALFTLSLLFDVDEEETKKTLVKTLASIHMLYPNIVEKFLTSSGRENLLIEVRKVKPEFDTGFGTFEGSGAVDLFAHIVKDVPEMTKAMIGILEEMTTYNDPMKFLRFAVRRIPYFFSLYAQYLDRNIRASPWIKEDTVS